MALMPDDDGDDCGDDGDDDGGDDASQISLVFVSSGESP